MAGGGPSYHYKFSLPVAQLSISPALASDTRLELTSTASNQTDVYILEVSVDLLSPPAVLSQLLNIHKLH